MAEEVVGLLDLDKEDNYLRDAGLDDIFPGSDDDLGFEEEVENKSDSEGEEEQETEL